MANSTGISALVRETIRPVIAENVIGSNPLFWRQAKRGIRFKSTLSFTAPMTYAKISQAGSYVRDQVRPTTQDEFIRDSEWTMSQYDTPIIIREDQEWENDSPDAKVDFVEAVKTQSRNSLDDDIGTDLFSANVDADPGNGNGMVGLQTIMSTTATVGGVTTTQMTDWKAKIDSSTTTLTLAAMQAQWGTQTVGNLMPTVLVATQANYDRLWALLDAKGTRYVNTDTDFYKAGFKYIDFNGVPVIVDSHATANWILFINEDHWFIAFMKQAYFVFEPYLRSPSQPQVKKARIVVACTQFMNRRNVQGAMTALTA